MTEQLTDEQIEDLLEVGDPTDEEKRLIRLGWDAARKQDTVLIRQLVEALGNSSAMEAQNADAANLRRKAIAEGRAWLEGNPC